MSSLIWPLVRNIASSKLNRDKIGHQIEKQFDPVRHDEALAYARAIKDENPRLGDPNGFVTPFYPSKLLFTMAKEMITLKGLNLNLLKMVHGEQEVLWHRPLRVGDPLRFVLKIEEIAETPAGDLLNLLGQGFKHDRLMIEAGMGFLVRRKTNREKKKNGEKELQEIFRIPFQTDEGQQLDYAKASGDNNFIHTSPFLAKLAGLPRTIMHGICVLAMTNSALSKKLLADDLTRLVSIKGRFANVVLPGQKLEVVGFEGDNRSEIFFEVINAAGKQVVQNGVFKFRIGD